MSAADRQKWDAKYAAGLEAPREPSAVLLSLADYLPTSGRVLDVAGGAGRHAIWLARRGLDVTLADISPAGLALAQQRATEAGVRLHTLQIDLELDPFPAGPWDLILSICYLSRPLLPVFPLALVEGGTLIVIQPTKKNRQRHDKPSPAYLLDEGELPRLIQGLQIVHHVEGWLADGRHDAVIVARRKSANNFLDAPRSGRQIHVS